MDMCNPSSSGTMRRTARVATPRVMPPLLEGRCGSGSRSDSHQPAERPVARKLVFDFDSCDECKAETTRKRKHSSSPSSTGSESGVSSGAAGSRGTEVSSASMMRSPSVVLVTRNLRLRRDSLASDLSSQSSLTACGRQQSAAMEAATPCSTLREPVCLAASPDEGFMLTAEPVVPQSPLMPAARCADPFQMFFERTRIGNPLERPPLALSLPGDVALASRVALITCEEQHSPAQQVASKLLALDTLLDRLSAAEHRSRMAKQAK